MHLEPDRPGTKMPSPWGSRRASPKSFRFTLDRVIRFVLIAGAAAIVGWLLWYFSGLVVYLVLGLIVAYLLRPVVDRFQGIGLGRIPAIFSAFMLIIVVISMTVNRGGAVTWAVGGIYFLFLGVVLGMVVGILPASAIAASNSFGSTCRNTVLVPTITVSTSCTSSP